MNSSQTDDPRRGTKPNSGFEWVGTGRKKPRTEHSWYILTSGSPDIPRWINFKQPHVQERFEKFKASSHQYAGKTMYWIVKHQKHGNKYKLIGSWESYETCWIDARNRLGTSKLDGFEIEWASKDVTALIRNKTTSVPTIESLWNAQIEAIDKAIGSGNPQRLKDAIDELRATHDQLEALQIVIEDRQKQAKDTLVSLLGI